ncbi:PilZ domain-containing protein [Paenibacillus solisilvae]|uniref:PilZ domain-containing protein n=1 Tax=Paenibacillus solisilvae TaxID=2486751 RepID=A0ABW0W3W6_9BACL
MAIANKQAVQHRQHIRIRIREGIQVRLSIVNVHGKDVESRDIPVYLKDISPSGLRFWTHLRFPVSCDYTVRFMITLGEWQFNLAGNIVWRGKDENQYVYGCLFFPDQKLRRALIQAISWKLSEGFPLGKQIPQIYRHLSNNLEHKHIGASMDVRS